MEAVNDDVILELTLVLPERVKELLAQTNTTYNRSIQRIEAKQLYWLKRLENMLNFKVPQYMYRTLHNWREAYAQCKKNVYWLFTSCDDAFYDVALLAGLDPSANNNIVLLTAAVEGKASVMRRLLEDPRCNPNVDNGNALKLAAERGHLEVVDVLLKDGRCDPLNGKDELAITYAQIKGYSNIVIRFLEDPRIAANSKIIDNVFDSSLIRTGTVVAEFMLNYFDIDPSVNNNGAIKLAADCGNTEAVKLLLRDKRVDPTTTDNYPIKRAFRNKNRDVVEALLGERRVRSTLSRKDLAKFVAYTRE